MTSTYEHAFMEGRQIVNAMLIANEDKDSR